MKASELIGKTIKGIRNYGNDELQLEFTDGTMLEVISYNSDDDGAILITRAIIKVTEGIEFNE